MIKKQPNGTWIADIRPNGRDGKRYRKSFRTKGEAERWAAWITHHKAKEKDWEPRRKDRRRLLDLVDRWYHLHGHNLRGATERHRSLLRIAERMGNPRAATLTAKDFGDYRRQRLETVSPNTANHEHAYLRALFNDLERLGEWFEGNPVAKVRQLQTEQTELTFLSLDQIDSLLTYLDDRQDADAHLIARVCLTTGTRWGEAENLHREQVHPLRVDLHRTKSRKPRSIPIPDCLYRTLEPFGPGRMFRPSYNAFRRAVHSIGLELPDGQLTHILRHTFASHFMMNGGDILTLQRVLGHGSLQMTMRYAHLSPDHLDQARIYGPLA